jgi:hypothetical protein
MTPESACTALRVEATRLAVWSCASSSDVRRDSFIEIGWEGDRE